MTSSSLPTRTPIALVEDNAALRAELVFHLQCAGYAATGLPHGAALQAHLAHQPCCLVVLDVGLPGEDGLSICATLRAQRPELGVVLLTARGAARDRLNGLHEGADAYLVKPTPPDELLAVIANLVRRLQPCHKPPAVPATWCLDAWRQCLIPPQGGPLPLTASEVLLLQVLVRCAPASASRRALAQALGDPPGMEYRLEMAISRLRRKLAPASPTLEPIRAVRGVGYALTVPCVEQAEKLSK